MANEVGGLRVLSAIDILEADDTVLEPVDVPEWGGVVYIRSLTGTERDRIEAEMTSADSGRERNERLQNMRAKMVQRAACDETGRRLFTHNQVEALGKKNAKALTRLFRKANELSGLSESDLAAIVEPLGEDQSDSSGGGLPSA